MLEPKNVSHPAYLLRKCRTLFRDKYSGRIRLRRLCMGLVVLFGSAAVLSLILILGLVFTAPDLDPASVIPSGTSTRICLEDGTVLRRLSSSSAHRELLPLDQIPASLQHAVISIEDTRFFRHHGIDLRGILRAAWNGVRTRNFSEGASTITQQLIKNTIFSDWTSESSFRDRFCRKVREQYLALRLESLLTKEEILENYLNTINFGSGCFGAAAASEYYFGKSASDLSLSEAAVLAAIPQNPSGLNPVLFPEKNSRRRQTILDYMEKQDYITADQHRDALADPVYERIRSQAGVHSSSSVFSFYEDALVTQVRNDLIRERDYSYEEASRAIFGGGLTIISAQDPALQTICEEAFADPANFPEEVSYGIDYLLSLTDSDGIVTQYTASDLTSFVRQHSDPDFALMCRDAQAAQAYVDDYRNTLLQDHPGSAVLSEDLTLTLQPQAAAVVIDQNTGYVRALVGGRGEKTASLTLNRATDTTRQPGSTFKILTVYAPALDTCGQTLSTTYENEPYEYTDGTPVSNWNLNDYTGSTTIRDAIIRSINVIAVRCITDISPKLGLIYAKAFGISTLQDPPYPSSLHPSDAIQPLALGGISRGVTALELCNAYAAIANGGIYHTPKLYLTVTDPDGTVLLDHTARVQTESIRKPEQTVFSESASSESVSPSDGVRILKASTAFLLTDAMRDVVTSEEGTAFGTISAGTQIPAAGKTGTTSGYKDIWFAGYTPYYTCCIWGGYDNNHSLPEASSFHTYSRLLWTSIMSGIHAGLPAADFPQPKSVTQIDLCCETHLPAVPNGCPEVYPEYFASDHLPEECCPLHESAPVLSAETDDPDPFPDLPSETSADRSSETADSLKALFSNKEEEQPQTSSLDDLLSRLNLS